MVVRCMAASAAATASDPAQLKSAREDIKELLRMTHCHPILVRTVIRVTILYTI
jgi:L-ascorbate peroxidase